MMKDLCLITLALLLLGGCVGPVPPQADHSAADLETVQQAEVSGVTIRLEASPYLNLMPRVIMPGQEASCENLILAVELQADGAWPAAVTADSVWIRSALATWAGALQEQPDSAQGDRMKVLRAQGCPPEGFREGVPVTVAVRLWQASKPLLYLEGQEQPLEAAH